MEQELDRLEKAGALQRVDHSEWAAPIVTVPKRDVSVRICGDYKVTVNSCLDVDHYPLPRPEDLFATLAGGKFFSTFDLSHADHPQPTFPEVFEHQHAPWAVPVHSVALRHGISTIHFSANN